MPGSPLSDSEGVLRVSLKSNGQPVADSVALVSVQVRRAVNSIPRARVELADGDMLSSAWPLAAGRWRALRARRDARHLRGLRRQGAADL